MPSSIQGTPVPRLLLAAPSSGSGKTTVVCALLQALKDRGLSSAAFKSGPDYIDPMFHRRVLDTPSYNLDLFLFGRHEPGAAAARETLLRHGAAADVAILEGAMGYYDGDRDTGRPRRRRPRCRPVAGSRLAGNGCFPG